MKVLFDTNIWMDLVLHRNDHYEAAACSYFGCVNDGSEIFIAATSLKDIFYLTSKMCDSQMAYEFINTIFGSAEIAAVDRPICEVAMNLEEPDFEDGIIAACALSEKADAIISRDKSAFKELEIPCYTPKEFMKMQGWEEIEF